MRIAIIGAGAAGCFAAIHIKHALPDAEVTVYEAQQRALAKVAITGGGRCNLTNSFAEVKSLESVYPRGARLMKRLFKTFDYKDTYRWFETNGVPLVTQDDQCVFPQSQDAMEIVNTLLRLMREGGVVLRFGRRVRQIVDKESVGSCGYSIAFTDERFADEAADVVVVTTGGSPREAGMNFLSGLGLEMLPPVPSLFSLCTPKNDITHLMGTVVEHASVTLAGTKLRTEGPLLITHWGVSGPAILKLSSHAARILAEKNYCGTVVVNWLGSVKEPEAVEMLEDMAAKNKQKQLSNVYPTQLNARFWQYLLSVAGLRADQRWGELGRKGLNRLAATLTAQPLKVEGKNRFKEEFVTCGGVSLSNVNAATLESKHHAGLYFAGEVLDVDAVTGGFNLQAAWTMAMVVSKAVSN